MRKTDGCLGLLDHSRGQAGLSSGGKAEPAADEERQCGGWAALSRAGARLHC